MEIEHRVDMKAVLELINLEGMEAQVRNQKFLYLLQECYAHSFDSNGLLLSIQQAYQAQDWLQLK